MTTVITKTYSAPPINTKEVLRYAGGCNDQNALKILNECIDEVCNKFTYKVCYCKLPLSINGNICHLGAFTVKSQHLANNLSNCNQVIVFAATVGIELDRLIAKYSYISPVKALFLQAIGSERIETLCDVFCNDIQKGQKIALKPRFSAGYGDLLLETQKDIFTLINPSKYIGLTLNDSMLMTPSKSVTAFIGLQEV